jgi:DNA repair protein RecO (recombination protein O)
MGYFFLVSEILFNFAAMLVKTRGIVLHSVKYGDTSLIVEAFTEIQGCMSFIVRIPKGRTTKIKKQLFQPLTILDMDCDVRQSAHLNHLCEVRLAIPYSNIPFDAYKLSMSFFIAEFLRYTLRSEQQNLPLFGYLTNSFCWLDGCLDSYSNFHLVFLMRLSRFLGFYPNLEGYADSGYFDLRGSCFTGARPSHSDFLESAEASRIHIMMRMNYETMHLYAMSREERNRCIEVIMSYYRLHIPDFPEMKSLSVLRELFE